MIRVRSLLILVGAMLVFGAAGCGSLGETAYQSGEATLRSLLDLLLTDLANQVADALGPGDVNGNGGGQDGGGDGGQDGGGDGSDGMTAGETLVADNCAACHGADGASGFAPNIQGVDAATIAARTSGEGGHTVFQLSEQDIADIAAYLGSF